MRRVVHAVVTRKDPVYSSRSDLGTPLRGEIHCETTKSPGAILNAKRPARGNYRDVVCNLLRDLRVSL